MSPVLEGCAEGLHIRINFSIGFIAMERAIPRMCKYKKDQIVVSKYAKRFMQQSTPLYVFLYQEQP